MAIKWCDRGQIINGKSNEEKRFTSPPSPSPDANGAFSYTSKQKKGGSVVMTKDGDIAWNWCALLAQDSSIAARWSAQQAELLMSVSIH